MAMAIGVQRRATAAEMVKRMMIEVIGREGDGRSLSVNEP
jgi:hypothetical protein